MSSEIARQKLREMGPPPGLLAWQKKLVLLLRCQDITQEEFIQKVTQRHHDVDSLFQQSLPESMEPETYLSAKEYYDEASEGLDCYLSGLEALLDWVETGVDTFLETSKLCFARGDKHSEQVIILSFEAQESFKQTEEALIESMKLGPEGIN